MDTDEARALLHAERERLTALLSDTADNVIAQQADDDPGGADGAKEVIDRELERSELRRVHDELREVDAAEERLRAVPTARRLASEQEYAERRARASDPNNPDLRA